ncbi:hypothetical protein ISP15_01600 [Dyella jejuensis]|uniref:Uncharacterized protein n=1 Tax=Dyella jejuensis TaxID=1432009 RepID=A0ABW8JD69_9GAMM
MATGPAVRPIGDLLDAIQRPLDLPLGNWKIARKKRTAMGQHVDLGWGTQQHDNFFNLDQAY